MPVPSSSLKIIVPAVVAAVVAAGAVIAVPRVGAATMSLEGLSASASVKASRDATWYGQMNAAGICRLFPGCTSATGSGSVYSLNVIGYVPGIGDISQIVQATVTERKAPRLLELDLATTGPGDLGTFSGTAVVRLARSGAKRTTLTVTVASATGTGAIGSALIPLLEDNLQEGLTDQVNSLNRSRAAARIRVTASGKPATKKKGARTVQVKGTTTVSVKVSTVIGVQPPPTASGKARVLGTDGRVACTATVKKSKATCTYRTGKHPPTKVRVVVTGSYTNGFAVWHAATGKVAS